MKKRWGTPVIIVGLMLVFAWTVLAEQQPGYDLQEAQETLSLMIKVMEDAGAETERIQLHYGKAYQTFDRVEDVEGFAEKLAARLGLAGNEQGEAQHHSEQFRFTRLEDDVLTSLQVHAIPSHSRPNAWDSYVILKLSAGSSGLDPLQQQLLQAYDVLESFQMMPQFYTCVQGNLDGKLENDVQLKTIHHILDQMGAEVVEKAEDSTVKSFSAYTSRLSTYITTDGRKMNVQAGMHVDQLHGITRLTIGTPIITIEY